MYPTMRPGDVLRIRSCPASAVAVGEREQALCQRREHDAAAVGRDDGILGITNDRAWAKFAAPALLVLDDYR